MHSFPPPPVDLYFSLQGPGEEDEDDDHFLPDGPPARARLPAAGGGAGGAPGVRLSVRPPGRPQLCWEVQQINL